MLYCTDIKLYFSVKMRLCEYYFYFSCGVLCEEVDEEEKLLKVVFTNNFFRILIKIIRSYHFGKKYLLKKCVENAGFLFSNGCGRECDLSANKLCIYIEKEQDNKEQPGKGKEQEK